MNHDPRKAIRQALMIARRPAAYGGGYDGYSTYDPTGYGPPKRRLSPLDPNPQTGDTGSPTSGPAGAPGTGNFGQDLAGFADAAAPAMTGAAIGAAVGGPMGAVAGLTGATMAQGLAEALGVSAPTSAPVGGLASVAGNIAQTQMGMTPTSNPLDAISEALTGPPAPADQEDADQGAASAAAAAAAAAAAEADNTNSMSEASTADAAGPGDDAGGPGGEGGGPGGGEGGGDFARGGNVGGLMDPRSLPGIHLKTNHRFAAGGGVQPDDDEEGFDAYHGSPHEFEKFDPNYIGSGEGHQIYGHGMYFAENEGTAQAYRDQLSGFVPGNVKIGDEEHPYWSTGNVMGAYRKKGYDQDAALLATTALQEHNGDPSAATANLWQSDHPASNKAINALLETNMSQSAGHMYHVRVKAKPEHFLDWDASLNEQSDHVKEKLKAIDPNLFNNGSLTGEDAYYRMVKIISGKPHKASEDLRDVGIPGIKYFDAGSRNQGKGTRNYVVFDPEAIEVKRRYADGGEIMPQRDLGADPTVQRAMDVTRQLNEQGMYSHAAEVAAGLPQAKGSPQQMLAMLSSRGVKPDEIKHSGVQDTFGNQKVVTKDQLAQHFQQNIPGIAETVLYKGGENAPRYEKYQLPPQISDKYDEKFSAYDSALLGALHERGPQKLPDLPKNPKNYREVLLLAKPKDGVTHSIIDEEKANDWLHEYAAESAHQWGDIDSKKEWDEAPRETKDWHLEIAKGRFNENLMDEAFKEQFLSKDAAKNIFESSHWNYPNVLGHIRMSDKDGGKTLHIEEFQSDWGQAKRNGKDVPDHPLINNTNAWTDMLLKRALREAAQGDYDRIAWTGGQDQVERYNLNKVERGEGMKSYYDKIVPTRITEVTKKLGVPTKVEPHRIDTEEGEKTLHSIKVTPELKDAVMRGMPAYNTGGAVGYADGGMPGDDPVVQRALDVTRQAQADQPSTAGTMQLAQAVTAPGRRRFEIAPARVAPATISDRPRDLPEEGSVTIKRLTDAFKKAIDNHLALPPAEQIANARQAENNVAQYVGRGKTGKINSVLTANKKLMKAQTAGEDDSPLTLPDGRTLEMTGLALMPDYREGQFKMCGNSDVCRDLCLGKESGQYRYDPTATQAQMPTTKEQLAAAGGKPRMAAFRRTMAMMRDPESFAVYLHELIDGAKIMAEKRGSHLGVRLNVLSDLSPKIMEPIIKAHPDVSFYDYTKMNYDPVADNHHYTYSSTGLSQPERGVENPFSNWRKMRDRLDQGHNVAMAFAHGKSDAFPEHLHDEETGNKYRVVSGDEHDFRPMDMVPEGEAGVIIALKNMAASNSEYKYENAARNSHGFFVHHNPDFERTPKGTFAVDQEGNRIPRNKVYTVPVQPMKRGAMRPQEN